MGGASLTLHKILHCLSICDWLNSEGISSVPMFWSASEDHDLHEMLKVELWNLDHTPQMFKISTIERCFAAETYPEPQNLHLEIKERLSPWLQKAFFHYPSKRYVDPFHHALNHIFGADGLLVVEPKDFRESALPFWESVQNSSEDLLQAYQSDEDSLDFIQAPRRRGLPIFALNSKTGKREALSFKEGLFFRDHFSKKSKLMNELLLENERLSPGALLRPILAQSQLPILISVLGPAEYQYHRQTPKAYRILNQTMPFLWPRFGGTYVPEYLENVLEIELQALDHYVLSKEKNWLCPSFKSQTQLTDITSQLEQLEQNFLKEHLLGTGPISRFKLDLQKSLHRLERGLKKAELIQQGWPRKKIELCENLLRPKGALQERRLGWVQFLDSKEKLQQLKSSFQDPFDFSHRIYR